MGIEGRNTTGGAPKIDHIEAYVREHTPLSSPRDEVVTRLKALDERNVIGSYAVQAVPTAVDLDGAGHGVERLYASVLDWAEDSAYTVEGPFQVRTWTNAFTEEAGETLVVPIVTLVAYVDDEIVAAVPCECTETEDTVTVRSYLDALLREEDLLGTIPEDRERGHGPERSQLP